MSAALLAPGTTILRPSISRMTRRAASAAGCNSIPTASLFGEFISGCLCRWFRFPGGEDTARFVPSIGRRKNRNGTGRNSRCLMMKRRRQTGARGGMLGLIAQCEKNIPSKIRHDQVPRARVAASRRSAARQGGEHLDPDAKPTLGFRASGGLHKRERDFAQVLLERLG